MYSPRYKVEELAKEFDKLQKKAVKVSGSADIHLSRSSRARARFILDIADIYWSNVREMQERPLGR